MSSDLLKDVIAYVEVRSNNDNRSAAVCRELQQLGAKVESNFTDDVTHVVFKEGMRRTFNKAQKKGIPLVSVTWLESCKANQKLMPEKDYAALIPEESDSPFLPHIHPNRRWRKMKSMQPYDYEEEVARSAERSVKRRRRVEEANRFKLLEGSTPTSSSPSLVLVADTQARSPFLSDMSRSHSPSLATVADTPITPTMKDRIEQMRKEQQNVLGPSDQSPKGTGRQKSAMLQKRLFEKLAKDIFKTEDSDDEEDDDTTARVVAKLIDGLESQEDEETQSPRKRMRRMSSHGNTPEQSIISDSQKAKVNSPKESPPKNSSNLLLSNQNHSPRRQSSHGNTPEQSITSDSQKAKVNLPKESPPKNSLLINQNCSPRRRSSRKCKQNNQLTPEAGEKVKCGNKVTASKSPRNSTYSCSKEGRTKEHSGLPIVLDSQSNVCGPSNGNTNKRKKMLLSELESCSALLDLNKHASDMRQSKEKTKPSKKKEKEKLSEEIAFLFGFNNKTKTNATTNRRRSARLSGMKTLDLLPNDDDGKSKFEKDHIQNLRTTTDKASMAIASLEGNGEDCDAGSTISDHSVNSSMSVMYEHAPSLLEEGSSKTTSRRSIDEFSLTPKGKNLYPQKRGRERSRRASNLGRVIESKSSEESENPLAQSSKIISLDGKKTKRSNHIEGSNLKESQKSSSPSHSRKSSSTSEDELMPRKLRHVSSLLMEMSINPLMKRSNLSLVMTSLHRHEQETVLSAVKKLGVFKVTDNVDENTTHVVCGGPRRTLNLLRAISRGCWVLKKEWVLESLEAKKWLLEENYEMAECFPVVKTTRCNRMKKGRSYKANLFSNCGPMLVAKTCTPPRKDIVDLITLCSGSVINSQQRAAIFIDDEYSSERMNIRPVWILDCIMKMEILDKEDYAIQAIGTEKRESSPEF